MSSSARLVRFFGAFLLALFLVLAAQTVAATQASAAVPEAQEIAPYQPPNVEADAPAWLETLDPLAQLPVWSQAALISAGLAAGFFVVPTAGRWVWRTVQRGRFSRETGE